MVLNQSELDKIIDSSAENITQISFGNAVELYDEKQELRNGSMMRSNLIQKTKHPIRQRNDTVQMNEEIATPTLRAESRQSSLDEIELEIQH